MPIHLPPLSRRQFLQRYVAGGTSLLLSRHLLAATPRATDPHCWALLSDTHIAADKFKIAREVNLTDRLTTVISEILAWDKQPAGALINGDLAFNTGEAADYETLAGLILPLRAAGIPLHLALGNHDHRERFWTGLREDKRASTLVTEKQISIVRSDRANWFLLDSLDQADVSRGFLGETQLAWLAQSLDANADKPALVMVHHNPNTGGNKGGLTETEALMDVLRPRRHVKAHFFGHSHRWSVERDESGIHLINLPATSYVFDKVQPTGWVKATIGQQGIALELRAHGGSHAAHGQVHQLAWRT